MEAEVIILANPYTYNFLKGLTHSALVEAFLVPPRIGSVHKPGLASARGTPYPGVVKLLQLGRGLCILGSNFGDGAVVAHPDVRRHLLYFALLRQPPRLLPSLLLHLSSPLAVVPLVSPTLRPDAKLREISIFGAILRILVC